MAKKTKYFFNPKSLSFEKVSENRRYIILRMIGFTSLIIVVGTILGTVFARFFASPREALLRREAKMLKTQLALIDRKVQDFEQQMVDLKDRDLKIYRSIYEAAPPKATDYRGADYPELKQLAEGALVLRIRQKLDALEFQANNQIKSYEELRKLVKSKEEMINAIPAIQPVANRDLTRMASGFGYRLDPFYHMYAFHPGMDFTADLGTPVHATGDGVVKSVSSDAWGYGNHIIIDHGYGYTTLYGHLSRMIVRPGQKVKRGQLIGNVGSTGKSTGPHLHYEVRKNNKPLNPAFFYHNDLSDEEYRRMLELSSKPSKSFD